MALPEKYRTRFRSTNMLERLNEEIRRRERVMRIFPNPESAIRLIGAMLAQIHKDWQERSTSIWRRSMREREKGRQLKGTVPFP